MLEEKIVCPYCGKLIPLTEALLRPIEEKIRMEYQKKFAEKEKEIEIIRENTQKQLKKEYEEKIKKIREEAKKEAENELYIKIEDLKFQLQQKEKKLKEAQEKELELIKRQRVLEEKEKTLNLEIARKIEEERKRMIEELSKRYEEEYQDKEKRYTKQIEDLKKQIEELKRKADQTPTYLIGELGELTLESILKENFPDDLIEPVPKGISGADVLQKIYKGDYYCGTIIWESKRTKNWNNDWIQKLKDDQREVKADIAVLVTSALPKGINNFGLVDGILVISHSLVVPIATLLRIQLIETTKIKKFTESKDEKIEILYNYLISPAFRQKIQAVVEVFINLKKELEEEQRAITRIWAKREKEIGRAIYNIAKMYGDLQGILGSSLPEIESLKLPELSKDIKLIE